MPQDPEIKAMSEIAGALDGLEDEAVKRVLRWAAERFQVALGSPRRAGVGARSEGVAGDGISAPDLDQYEDFATFFDAANPQSAADNALVAGYWFQVIKEGADFDSQSLNTELKHLGRASSNITRDLDALINRSPRHVIQVRKSGNTRQARKRYKLTTEGIRVVQRMLQAKSNDEEG